MLRGLSLHDLNKAVILVTARCDVRHKCNFSAFFLCLCVSAVNKKKGAELGFRAFPSTRRKEPVYLPRVKSTLVLPAIFTTCDVVLPLCHTNALYSPSGTFWMK